MSIDIQRVKAFNEELKRYNEKAAQISAEIEFNNREIKRICEELTAELGISVTIENIDQIANERLAKIENTLQSGEAILQRIRQEEEAEEVNSQQEIDPVQSVNTDMSQFSQAPVGDFTQQTQPVQQSTYQGFPAGQVAQAPVQANQGIYIDQFNQLQQPATQVEFKSQPVVTNPQTYQAATPSMPQMQPVGGIPNFGNIPAFQVGNKSQQNSQPKPINEIGNPDIFGSSPVQL